MTAPSRTTSALVVALGVALGALLGIRSEPFHPVAEAEAATHTQAARHAEVIAIDE